MRRLGVAVVAALMMIPPPATAANVDYVVDGDTIRLQSALKEHHHETTGRLFNVLGSSLIAGIAITDAVYGLTVVFVGHSAPDPGEWGVPFRWRGSMPGQATQ